MFAPDTFMAKSHRHRPGLGLLLALCACGSGGAGDEGETSATATSDTSPDTSDTSDTSESESTEESGETGGTGDPPVASSVGAPAGFVSAVAFAADGTLWLSGDDVSGLYRRAPGQVLERVTAAPDDWSTYDFLISPDGSQVVAPSHFGRGIALSDDAGASFDHITDGVPQGADDLRRIDGVAWDTMGRPVMATGGGLFRVDGNVAVAVNATGLGTATWPGYLLTRNSAPSGDYLLGDVSGRLYTSPDLVTWTELPTDDGRIPVSDLAQGQQGSYVATAPGVLVRIDGPAGVEVLADPNADARFASGLWSRVAVAPNPNQAGVDRIVFGVVGLEVGAGNDPQAERARDKLFVSDDGGQSFVARSAGLGGASIFDIAIDPTDADHIALGTVGDGAWESFDAGQSWSPVEGELRAHAALGLAVDPADPEHAFMASSEGLSSTVGLLERVPSAGSWAWERRDALDYDARSLAFVDGALYAAGFDGYPSVARSANAAAGPFETELENASVTRLVATSEGLFALGDALRLRQSDGSWPTVLAVAMSDVAHVPDGGDTSAGRAMACGVGVYVSQSGRFDDAVPVESPSDFLWSCTIAGDGTLLAAGSQLHVAPALDDPTWSQLTTPLDGANLISVATLGDTWIIGGGDVDVGATVSSPGGVYTSTDRGQSWQPLEGLDGSGTVYQFARGSTPDELWLGLWGGGPYRVR